MTRLAYLAKRRARVRPSPEPVDQADPLLPPRGVMVFSADETKVQCHCCGRWYGSLNSHLRTHGMDADGYRETYDLARTASLWPPALQANQRELALGKIAEGKMQPHPEILHARASGQAPRLGMRIAASKQRAGINTRAGNKCRTVP